MAKRVQLRRGTTAQSNAFTGAVGEVTVDTDKDVLVVHDGVTIGGHPNAARANQDNSVSIIRKDGTSLGTINANGLFYNGTDGTSVNQAATAAVAKNLQDQITNAFNQQYGVGGQSWQNVTGSRASGVNYINSTSRPIIVSIFTDRSGSGDAGVTLYVNGQFVGKFDTGDGGDGQVITIVPSGSSYLATINTFTLGTNAYWMELR